MELSEKEKDAIFYEALDSDNFPIDNSTFLYRYIDNIGIKNTIDRENGILKLRFVDANSFDDRTEGKAILRYYRIAIESLYEEKKISLSYYKKLKNIKIPNDQMFSYYEGSISYYKNRECYAYAYCLSKKESNKKLISETNKYSIKLIKIPEEELIQKQEEGMHFEVFPILYGKDAIEHIKGLVLKYYNNKYLSIDDEFIIDMLRDLKYVVKKEKYRKEDEVRVLLLIDKDKYGNNEFCKYQFIDFPFCFYINIKEYNL